MHHFSSLNLTTNLCMSCGSLPEKENFLNFYRLASTIDISIFELLLPFDGSP